MAGSTSAALARKKFQQIFTSSGNFTVPAGVYEVFVTLVGGGGSGCIAQVAGAVTTGRNNRVKAHRGATGFYLRNEPFVVTPGAVIPVLVGAGAAAITAEGGTGLTGGASSFGALEVKGGNGGNYAVAYNATSDVVVAPAETAGGIGYVSSVDGTHRAVKAGIFPAAAVSTAFTDPSAPSALNTAPFPWLGSYGAGGYSKERISTNDNDYVTLTSGAGQNGVVLVEWYL